MNIPKAETLDSFAEELDALRAEVQAKVGEKDARYIRRLIGWHRVIELSSRVFIALGFFHPILWVFGVLALALAKILDNMEIGHNVMHGQYDWMNDPHINSRNFEWDIAGEAGSWKRYHNFEHHTYTNIIGKDRDYGYGLLRLSNDIKWRPKNRFQFLTYFGLSSLFEWGVAYHELAGERIFMGKRKEHSNLPISREQLKRDFFGKAGRQIFKDYIFFPLLCWPVALQVLIGNFIANIIRNYWTSTVIFCGHFTEDAHTFKEEDCVNETQGQWYYRQILGSGNFSGSKVLHLLTGHLSFQIEHHLFPDIPAPRYQEMAPRVREICKRHGVPYNTASFGKQYLTVLQRVWKYSFKKSELEGNALPVT